MYRELIAECSRGNNWAKLQPPCPMAEIESAEAYIGYAFPAALKELLLETNGDRWLLHSVQEIIENVRLNRSILAECFDEPEEFPVITVDGRTILPGDVSGAPRKSRFRSTSPSIPGTLPRWLYCHRSKW